MEEGVLEDGFWLLFLTVWVGMAGLTHSRSRGNGESAWEWCGGLPELGNDIGSMSRQLRRMSWNGLRRSRLFRSRWIWELGLVLPDERGRLMGGAALVREWSRSLNSSSIHGISYRLPTRRNSHYDCIRVSIIQVCEMYGKGLTSSTLIDSKSQREKSLSKSPSDGESGYNIHYRRLVSICI